MEGEGQQGTEHSRQQREQGEQGAWLFHEHREARVAGAVWGSGRGRGGSESSLAGEKVPSCIS